MKKIMLCFAALTALVVAIPATAATVNVAITRAGFVPIKQGDGVTWTNAYTTSHQVASQNAPFASPVLAPTQTFSYTFAKAGKFNVTDPQNKNRKMTVNVEEA